MACLPLKDVNGMRHLFIFITKYIKCFAGKFKKRIQSEVLFVFPFAQIHAIYRSGTETNRITMDKARQEFQSGFFGNQIVRDAAAGAARATVQSQFNQNRY